jgi:hypothetical protein
MELVPGNVHLMKPFVSDSDSFGVFVCIQLAPDDQSSTGGRGSNEIYNHLVADKRLPSLVLSDVG